MVFAFDGFDPNGVPIYVSVPHGDQDIAKPQEAATTPKQVVLQPTLMKPTENVVACAVPCEYFIAGLVIVAIVTWALTGNT